MHEHLVSIRGDAARSIADIDLLHTNLEALAGDTINASLVGYDNGQVTYDIYIDAPNQESAYRTAQSLITQLERKAA